MFSIETATLDPSGVAVVMRTQQNRRSETLRLSYFQSTYFVVPLVVVVLVLLLAVVLVLVLSSPLTTSLAPSATPSTASAAPSTTSSAASTTLSAALFTSSPTLSGTDDIIHPLYSNVIRHMVRCCGDPEVFLTYCDKTGDYEGKIEFFIERGYLDEAFQLIQTLLRSGAARNREFGEKLLRKYFTILWESQMDKLMEYLVEKSLADLPMMYTCLITSADQPKTVRFAEDLLRRKDEKAKNQNTEPVLVHYLFWKYMERDDDDLDEKIKAFLETNKHYKVFQGTDDVMVRALRRKGLVKALFYVHEEERKYEEAIEDALVLLQRAKGKGGDPLYSPPTLIQKIVEMQRARKVQPDFVFQRALREIITHLQRLERPEQQVLDFLITYKVPIELVLLQLPGQWTVKTFREQLIARIAQLEKSYKDITKQANKICESSSTFEKSTAQNKKCFAFHFDSVKCSFCAAKILDSTKDFEMNQGTVFPCSHAFHLLCIKNEVGAAPTDA